MDLVMAPTSPKEKNTNLYRVFYVEASTTLSTPAMHSEVGDEESDEHDTTVTSNYVTGVKNTVVRLSVDKAEKNIEHIQRTGSTLMSYQTLKVREPPNLVFVQDGKQIGVLRPPFDETDYARTVVRIDKVDEN